MDIVERLRFCVIGKYDIDAAADEIERLREQNRMNWDAFQKAAAEVKRLREELQWAIKDCDAKTNHESIKRELLEALEGK
jgi:molecular chaperone GrpE (heat shock protein)